MGFRLARGRRLAKRSFAPNSCAALLLCLLLSGGAQTNDYGAKLPYDAWRLGFIARNYVEVWIKTSM